MEIGSQQVENLINNKAIFSSYFLDDKSYFLGNKLNKNNNLLLKNVSKLLGVNYDEFTNMIESVEINWLDNSKQSFNLEFFASKDYEWNKELYGKNLDVNQQISVDSNKKLTIHNLTKNDSKIIEIDQETFVAKINNLNQQEKEEFFNMSTIIQSIVDLNVGIENVNEIQSVNYQITKNGDFSLKINLATNYYDKNLENFILVNNLEIDQKNDESIIDLSKIDFIKFINVAHQKGSINLQYLKRVMDNKNLVFEFSHDYRKDILNWLCESLNLSVNSIKKVQIQLKNLDKDISYKNVNDLKWAIPLTISIFKNDGIEFVNDFSQITQINFLDSYTNVKVNKDSDNVIVLQTDLVGVMPSIEINKSKYFEPYNFNVFTLDYFDYINETIPVHKPNANNGTGDFITSWSNGGHLSECKYDDMEWGNEDFDCGVDLTNMYGWVFHYLTIDSYDIWDTEIFMNLAFYSKQTILKDVLKRMDFFTYAVHEPTEENPTPNIHAAFKFIFNDYVNIEGLTSISNDKTDVFNTSNENEKSIVVRYKDTYTRVTKY